MAEHAAQAQKPARPEASATATAAVAPGSHGELLNRRGGAALAGYAQLLAGRAAANPLTAPVRAPAPRPVQLRPNRTGLPDGLKAGVEALSGLSMDDVRVHRNSPRPAQLNAHAYAQGTDIHLAPRQDHHLPHEAWHVVQQKQGRVKPTLQMRSAVPINDDARLEAEADIMGRRAMTAGAEGPHLPGDSEVINAAPAAPRTEAAAPAPESGDPTRALQAVIARLEALSKSAEALGDPSATSKGEALQERLTALRKIADGSDAAAKREAVTRLEQELSGASLPTDTSGAATVQRITGFEIAILIVGLGLLAAGIMRLLERRPTTRLRLVGIHHDAQHSYASVVSEAHLTDVNQRVRYYIRWDANVVPGGNHLQQIPGVASGWVIDRSPQGLVIGSRANGMGGFFADPGFSQPDDNGLHFHFPDGIQQRVLNHGSWWFRLQVQSPGGGVLSSSEVRVNWNH